MQEFLTSYRDLTQAIIDLFLTSERIVDAERLDELLAQRDKLIERQSTLPNLRGEPALQRLTEEIVQLDARARELLREAMQETQQSIQQLNTQSRRTSAYEQAYQPDAMFFDKKK
ncbi:hypothetical protein [Tumebacillus permanentifrigoris]|uniref:Flagellar protein FliT n=1 Tax=Tumebacillus permanentifrigoris TaxID=378543 RepID=A0A316DF08_9BACL|nr:hypothetical protein [Tumebacillus permanentifrigoris]PWK16168.1 hypothetical protein C7459_10129 [Tumebacillus permanentifrigoris]